MRIKRQAEMKTIFVIFAALMVCYAMTLVERWGCQLGGLFEFADSTFRSNFQIWWPHFFAAAKKSFFVHYDFSWPMIVTGIKVSAAGAFLSDEKSQSWSRNCCESTEISLKLSISFSKFNSTCWICASLWPLLAGNICAWNVRSLNVIRQFNES